MAGSQVGRVSILCEKNLHVMSVLSSPLSSNLSFFFWLLSVCCGSPDTAGQTFMKKTKINCYSFRLFIIYKCDKLSSRDLIQQSVAVVLLFYMKIWIFSTEREVELCRTEYYLSLCQLQSTQNSHFILNLNLGLPFEWSSTDLGWELSNGQQI